MLPACVVFANTWEVADPNKADADVAVVVAGVFAVTAAGEGVDGGVDGWDNVGVLNIEECGDGVEVGDPKNGCDFESETKINHNYIFSVGYYTLTQRTRNYKFTCRGSSIRRSK